MELESKYIVELGHWLKGDLKVWDWDKCEYIWVARKGVDQF